MQRNNEADEISDDDLEAAAGLYYSIVEGDYFKQKFLINCEEEARQESERNKLTNQLNP